MKTSKLIKAIEKPKFPSMMPWVKPYSVEWKGFLYGWAVSFEGSTLLAYGLMKKQEAQAFADTLNGAYNLGRNSALLELEMGEKYGNS